MKDKEYAAKRYSVFTENITQDLLLFIFFLLLTSLYRIAFIYLFRDALQPGTPFSDIALTLWYGFRISLKTSAAFIIPSFLLGTVLNLFLHNYKAFRLRYAWGCFSVLVFSILFQTRLPYYQEFHNAFDPFVFNTMHDDVWAIVVTAVRQYNAVWRVLAGLVCAGVFGWFLFYWLKLSALMRYFWNRLVSKKAAVAAIIVFIPVFAVFMRKGGSFTYNGSIYWKNSARMTQHLLNEAILDDIQALYKASRIYKYFARSTESMSAADVRKAAALLNGKKDYPYGTLEPLLERKARGNKIKKPRHIFVIVGETYMLWPLWEKYSYLHIADGMKGIIAESNGLLVRHFISASNGTMFGLTSVLLGLPEINLYTANRPSASFPYKTALSVQLKKLGYKTRFFYGGYSSWENVGVFMKNQQVDESYYMGSFGEQPHNAWGIEDKYFLRGVAGMIKDEPSFNLILTSSNHPPLSVDMTKEPGINTAGDFGKLLPENYPNKADMEVKLQNFQYADRYLAEFIRSVYKKYPDSIFIVTGDHASRYTVSTNPSEYERVGVPLVIFGQGISKDMLGKEADGAHMDIAATVLELILPRGSIYYALGNDILGGNVYGLHSYRYLYKDTLGDLNSEELWPMGEDGKTVSGAESETVKERMNAVRRVTWWLVMKGLSLEER